MHTEHIMGTFGSNHTRPIHTYVVCIKCRHGHIPDLRLLNMLDKVFLKVYSQVETANNHFSSQHTGVLFMLSKGLQFPT